MPVTKKSFGQLIERLRAERKWTLAELGAKVGVSAQMIFRYESGESDPPYTRVEQFAEAFGIPVGDLYEPEEPTHGN